MQDSFAPDLFPYLGMKEKEQLKILADLDGLTLEEEVKALIQTRARVVVRAQGLLNETPKRAGLRMDMQLKSVQIEDVPPLHEGIDPNHLNIRPEEAERDE